MEQAKNTNAKIAIVTSCNGAAAKAVVDITGLCRYTDFIVASDDVKMHKPHPEPYLKAIELFKADPQSCVIVEDSRAGLLAACNACVGTVCYFSGSSEDSEAASVQDTFA